MSTSLTVTTKELSAEKASHLPEENNSIDLSVIIPLTDHRGQAIKCIRSFAQKQTYDRDRYEVIVITEGNEPQLDAQVKELLGEQDWLFYHEPCHEFQLYDFGSRQAKGKLLFFTEPHCIAASNCIEEIINYFKNTNYEGASCKSSSLCFNLIAKMEDKLFHENFDIESEEKYWNKVYLRGFILYKSVLLEKGGFEYEYGNFAERILGAKLYSQGYKLGYVEKAIVCHCNDFILEDIFQPQNDFVQGECAYRAKTPAEYCDRYFGHVPEWSNREAYRKVNAQSLCKTLLKSLPSSFYKRYTLSVLTIKVKALLYYSAIAFWGINWLLFKSFLSLRLAHLRAKIWNFNPEKLYPAYCDYWTAIIPYSRFQYMAENLSNFTLNFPESHSYNMAEIEEERLIGFHGIENWENKLFRWSEAVATLQVSLPPGNYKVELETLSVCPEISFLCLEIYFDSHRIKQIVQDSNSKFINFQVDETIFNPQREAHHLTVVCNPMRPWKQGVSDRRELGLPLKAINFRPIDNETPVKSMN